MVLMSGPNWTKLQKAREPGRTVLTDFGSPDEKCVVFPSFFSALLGKRDVMVHFSFAGWNIWAAT